MSTVMDTDAMRWVATWTQAMSDWRTEEDEAPIDDLTVRLTLPISVGGGRVRVELSNQFGDEPVRIGRGAVGLGKDFVGLAVGGQASFTIPAGASVWSDPLRIAVQHGDDLLVDLYLPAPTPYVTAGGFIYARSTTGDFVGSSDFPVDGPAAPGDEAARAAAASGPDGLDWALANGGPFLRTIEVADADPTAVIVGLGSSSMAMGWPQIAASLIPADARVAVLNRGIAGNRLRFDAPASSGAWGRSGLSRFDEDVLGTRGATHVVIAYNSNDWGLPGRGTSMDEMPTVEQLIDAYRELIVRSEAAGLTALLATITPLSPELLAEYPEREDIRAALNEWIRTFDGDVIDFDAALRSPTNPATLDDLYAAVDHTHPNINGEKRLAEVMVEKILRQEQGSWFPTAPLA